MGRKTWHPTWREVVTKVKIVLISRRLPRLLLRRQPPLLQNLHPQALRRQLDIQHRSNTTLPRLLKTSQLAEARILRNLALLVDLLRGALSIRQFFLHTTQDLLQLGVANQPRVLAVFLQQCEILVSLGQV